MWIIVDKGRMVYIDDIKEIFSEVVSGGKDPDDDSVTIFARDGAGVAHTIFTGSKVAANEIFYRLIDRVNPINHPPVK